MVHMNGDRLTKGKKILNLKRRDVDVANGSLKAHPEVQCDKTRRLVLAQYRVRSGTDDDYLLPFDAKNMHDSLTRLNRAIDTFKSRMEKHLTEAENAADPWKNLPG
jgi:hypothetical protein